MLATSSDSAVFSATSRDIIHHALHHIEHVLPAQAPILNFVHHNTLHGFQHLPFEEALQAFEAITGTKGYLPQAQYRQFYKDGRINDADLFAAIAMNPTLKGAEIVCQLANKPLYRKDLYHLALLFDFNAITPPQLSWQAQELNVFASESAKQLWKTIIAKLDLPGFKNLEGLHPEDLFPYRRLKPPSLDGQISSLAIKACL